MQIGQQIKSLRKEKHWSQNKLAKEVGADARQISRYENERITPSVEAVVRLASVFNVSVDHLLLNTLPRKPLNLQDTKFLDRFQEIQELTGEDQTSLLHILDALVTKNKLKSITDKI